jgi:hypothetical protein
MVGVAAWYRWQAAGNGSLWSLTFSGPAGETALGAQPDTLYFTAGPKKESGGLFGTITPNSYTGIVRRAPGRNRPPWSCVLAGALHGRANGNRRPLASVFLTQTPHRHFGFCVLTVVLELTAKLGSSMRAQIGDGETLRGPAEADLNIWLVPTPVHNQGERRMVKQFPGDKVADGINGFLVSNQSMMVNQIHTIHVSKTGGIEAYVLAVFDGSETFVFPDEIEVLA